MHKSELLDLDQIVEIQLYIEVSWTLTINLFFFFFFIFIFFFFVLCLQIAGYIQELLTAAGIQLNMGLIQTAYANGSSTHYATAMLVSFHMFQSSVYIHSDFHWFGYKIGQKESAFSGQLSNSTSLAQQKSTLLTSVLRVRSILPFLLMPKLFNIHPVIMCCYFLRWKCDCALYFLIFLECASGMYTYWSETSTSQSTRI